MEDPPEHHQQGVEIRTSALAPVRQLFSDSLKCSAGNVPVAGNDLLPSAGEITYYIIPTGCLMISDKAQAGG